MKIFCTRFSYLSNQYELDLQSFMLDIQYNGLFIYASSKILEKLTDISVNDGAFILDTEEDAEVTSLHNETYPTFQRLVDLLSIRHVLFSSPPTVATITFLPVDNVFPFQYHSHSAKASLTACT